MNFGETKTFSAQQDPTVKILACHIMIKNILEDVPHSGTLLRFKRLWGCVMQAWPAKCTLFFVKLWPSTLGEKCTLPLQSHRAEAPLSVQASQKGSVWWGSFQLSCFLSSVPSSLIPACILFLSDCVSAFTPVNFKESLFQAAPITSQYLQADGQTKMWGQLRSSRQEGLRKWMWLNAEVYLGCMLQERDHGPNRNIKRPFKVRGKQVFTWDQ